MYLTILAHPSHNTYCFLTLPGTGETVAYLTNTDGHTTWYTWPMDGHMACGNNGHHVARCEQNGFFTEYATEEKIKHLHTAEYCGYVDLTTGVAMLTSHRLMGLFNKQE